MRSISGIVRRVSVTLAGVLMATAAMGAVAAPRAQAAPLPSDPETVTGEALPTWQLNGVVWSTVVVGNTAYVTGEFSKARPPGTSTGNPAEVAANNIFAFDVTSGNPVAFNHSLNAQGLVIRANDAGTRLYVGGDFTSVDGVARGHIAAFDLTTSGAPLTTFNARTDGQVRALVPIGNTVYAGGNFRAANSQARSLLAAYDASSGNLLPWAPVGDTAGYVFSMVAAPDKSRVIAAGSFTKINGIDAYGMGSIDAASGATLPWAANTRLRAAGANGAITTVSTDGISIFGAGYAFGSGATFEGTFSAEPSTGAINWVNDCLGDTYDTFPMGGALYTVSHDHDCSVAGAFPDTNPRNRWQNASAERIGPTIGTITRTDAYGWDYRGLGYTGQLHWYPQLAFGTYTDSKQAAWSIGGNGTYLVMAGEFPKVNGANQQSLVRFAKRPISQGLKPSMGDASNPTPIPSGSGKVRVVFGAMNDRDDAVTEYDIYRQVGTTTTRIATLSYSDAEFWNLPTYTYTDTGLANGTQVRYQTRARDAAGNFQWSAWSGYVTVADSSLAYVDLLGGQQASHLWRLGEAAGSTLVIDAIGSAHGTPTSETFGVAGALSNETSNTAMTSAASSRVTTTTPETAPEAVTVEAWVKTTSSRGGRIVGFGDQAIVSGGSTITDRVLYLDNSGRPNFMINDTAMRTVTARNGIRDGNWHLVTGVVGANGMELFVDGVRVARDQRYTTPRSYSGFWRLGSDNTTGFTNRPSDGALVGQIDEVAVFPKALSLSEVQAHYTGSGRAGAWTAQPTDPYATAVVGNSPDLFWRLGESSGNALDSSASGNDGTVTGSPSRGLSGPIAGNSAWTFNGSSNVVVAQQQWTAPTAYTAEIWFKTNTTRGGKLIGFGNAASGLSSSSDRHVYMLNDGKLAFGANDGAQRIITSSLAYNNNQWHHVAATQGSGGMALYVDGVLVGSNSVTGAQAYTGYWRIGGDRVWSGTSNYFAGSLDEAAVYPSALSEDDVRAHYAAAGMAAPNRPPVAAFTATNSFLTVNVDGGDSTDPDGGQLTYAWDFGDGSTGSGVTAEHTYAVAGAYTVSLTVTDPETLSNTTTKSVTVAANLAPTAAFTSTVDFNEVAFDAGDSADADGTIESYAWDFGDGKTGTGKTANHTYAEAGTYTVKLTVTDDQDATATVTHDVVTVEAPNQLPSAVFTSDKDNLKVSFDAGDSTDPDGTIESYAWDFGDDATGTGTTVDHTYAEAGRYTVKLTVTDNRGGADTVQHNVTVTAANVKPVAAFTATAADAKVSVDAGDSTDPDGTIESYAWDFGDGATGTGKTASHTYAASGTYTVKLTVTDDRDGKDSATQSVAVTVSGPLAEDAFGRSVSSGWGTADTGGNWAIASGASRFSVADGKGKVTISNPGSGYTAKLNSVSATSTDMFFEMSADKAATGGGLYVTAVGRDVAGAGSYSGTVHVLNTGAVQVLLEKTVGGTETVLANQIVQGLSFTAGTTLKLRLQVTGTNSTSLKVKVWSGANEPGSWNLSTTDSTAALQAAGAIGINPYLSGSATNAPLVFTFDNLVVVEP